MIYNNDLDDLVAKLHENGLSQVAAVLNIFLCNATTAQRFALVEAINSANGETTRRQIQRQKNLQENK